MTRRFSGRTLPGAEYRVLPSYFISQGPPLGCFPCVFHLGEYYRRVADGVWADPRYQASQVTWLGLHSALRRSGLLSLAQTAPYDAICSFNGVRGSRTYNPFYGNGGSSRLGWFPYG